MKNSLEICQMCCISPSELWTFFSDLFLRRQIFWSTQQDFLSFFLPVFKIFFKKMFFLCSQAICVCIQERNRTSAKCATARSPTRATSGPTSRPTKTWRSTSAKSARKPSPACPCSTNTRAARAAGPDHPPLPPCCRTTPLYKAPWSKTKLRLTSPKKNTRIISFF